MIHSNRTWIKSPIRGRRKYQNLIELKSTINLTLLIEFLENKQKDISKHSL